jgi:hypothetical protein
MLAYRLLSDVPLKHKTSPDKSKERFVWDQVENEEKVSELSIKPELQIKEMHEDVVTVICFEINLTECFGGYDRVLYSPLLIDDVSLASIVIYDDSVEKLLTLSLSIRQI